ncbi:type VI secretion system tip protein VgrG [Marinigracilibium pacificum]|uniref:Type VI secretion system tip protein VgrG n=1 Tax=Marinigracilibium pacificum TaxID=2729599 RepID=A0A848IZG9_9BACT|nr:type VI secretion system tip protein VgrG [Marinigracilibium pacificum]NMM49677.1 type VI secretion system tip protein VgrG [Marinigracilibium pacificum]
MISRNIHETVLDVVSYSIFSNGTELPDNFAVESISVTKSVNKISSARLTLQDGNIPAEDFPSSNQDEFLPGNEIEIKIGYRDNIETVFKGILIKHGIKTREDEPSQLIIELKDIAIKMTIGRKNRYFQEVTDSDIIEEILGEYDVDPDVESMTVNHPEMVQYYCTDWDFMVTRAEANGKLVFVDDGAVIIKSPDLSSEPVLDLVYGQNIKEFDACMDARDQFGGITSNSWDYAQQEIVSFEGADPMLDSTGNVSVSDLSDVIGLEALPQQHGGRVSPEELQSLSDARFLRSRLAKVRGRLRIIGYSQVKPGDVVQLGGLGDRFNGVAFVSSVGHHYGLDSSWYTDIEVGLSQEWLIEKYDNVMAKPSASMLPSIQGLHIGVVTAIHDDPEGEDRVQVRLPIIDAENEGIWARVSSLDAGENRGAFFRPEVDDEVVVGFINDDPRYAIILGMLHSSAKPAPITATEENSEKGFITKSELKILFNDDTKVITIITPNENKVELNDDSGSITVSDENGNSILMDSSGITIESAGDVNITASGDINLEGTNINATASANVVCEGSSGAEFKTSGIAKIEGSLVQIN